MSIYVSDFGDGTTWTVTHDDSGHGGPIDPTSVQHPVGIGGIENHNLLAIICPVCQAVSVHPASGGAQPQSVQQMFVTHAQSNGCPCGQVAAGDPEALAASHVRLQCNRLDGPGRWHLS